MQSTPHLRPSLSPQDYLKMHVGDDSNDRSIRRVYDQCQVTPGDPNHGNPEDNEQTTNDKIRWHAGMRCHIVKESCSLIGSLWKAISPFPVPCENTYILSAPAQGPSSPYPDYQAAHHSPFAGLVVLYKEQLAESIGRNGVTGSVDTFLQGQGFKETEITRFKKDIEEIRDRSSGKKNISKDLILSTILFKKLNNNLFECSVGFPTQFNRGLQATQFLPTKVNNTDSYMERDRGKILKIFRDMLDGELLDLQVANRLFLEVIVEGYNDAANFYNKESKKVTGSHIPKSERRRMESIANIQARVTASSLYTLGNKVNRPHTRAQSHETFGRGELVDSAKRKRELRDGSQTLCNESHRTPKKVAALSDAANCPQ